MTFSHAIHLLPVLWPALICVTVFTPYIIAVLLHHVYPLLPSISKNAAFEPEGSIFGFLMTFVAFFGLLIIFCRYLQLERIQGDCEQNVLQKVKWFNKVSLPFGFLCILSVVVVANFRIPALNVKKGSLQHAIYKVHDAGTGLLLVSGALYYWFQTLISYYTVKAGLNTKCTFIFRLAVSCIMTMTGIAYPLLKPVSYTMFSGSDSFSKVASWNPKEDGYAVHVADSAGEWIACLSLAIYAVSFYKEFQTFSVEVCFVENDELKGEKHGGYSKIKQNKEESENDK